MLAKQVKGEFSLSIAYPKSPCKEFTYIWLEFMVNVGKYCIHGAYGFLPILDCLSLKKPTESLLNPWRWWRVLFPKRRQRKTISPGSASEHKTNQNYIYDIYIYVFYSQIYLYMHIHLTLDTGTKMYLWYVKKSTRIWGMNGNVSKIVQMDTLVRRIQIFVCPAPWSTLRVKLLGETLWLLLLLLLL